MVKVFLFFISFHCAFAGPSWQSKLQSTLPVVVQSFQKDVTTLKEVEKRIGRADLKEGKQHYWIMDGLKYALTLSFEKDVLKSMHFTFVKRPHFSLIQHDLSLAKFKLEKDHRLHYKDVSGVEVVVDPADKTITSVVFP